MLCAATIEDRVPPHLRGKGTGWVTGTYEMLPRATAERSERESAKGKIGGRTHEIQRLVGRSLRGVVDLARLGERTITVDCDVLVADGGTRTASITGGYVALAAAMITYGMDRHLTGHVAAVSVGIIDGVPYLDLDYSEDSRAEVDFNVVGTDAGAYVELQGTAEGKPFDRASLDRLLDLANAGLATAVRRPRPRRSRRSAASGVAARPRLLVATRSRHKLRELGELLGPAARRGARCRPTTWGSRASPTRPGSTFETNARIKARWYAARSGLPTLADDSGLEVDALGGGPGVYTRRYAGPDATDADNNAKLLRELGDLPADRRGARYVCVLALALPGEAGPRGGLRVLTRRGTCRGRIATGLRGRRRVRLRPAVRAASRSRRAAGRWASGRAAEKHAISHRSRAARRMAPVLRGVAGPGVAAPPARRRRPVHACRAGPSGAIPGRRAGPVGSLRP